MLTELHGKVQLGYGIHALMNQCRSYGLDVEYVPYADLKSTMRPAIWLVSIHHAMQYYNVLSFFKKIDVEPHRDIRKEKPLLICGGGPVSSNPLPLSDFFDLFCIGDGEEWIIEALHHLEAGVSTPDVAETVEGSWIPEWGTERVVKRRVFDAIEKTPCSLQFTGRGSRMRNVIYVETARGCRHKCYFCKLGWTQPYREIDRDQFWEKLSLATFKFPRYHRLALMAPDAGGVSWAYDLPTMLEPLGMSVPYLSSRFDSTLIDFNKRNVMYRFGLEGMSERQRHLVGKFISDDTIRAVMHRVYNALGCALTKWFIITGLPGECDADYIALGKLFRSLARVHPAWGILRVSATQFVPEPYTPMQWFPVCYDSEVIEKLEEARQMIRSIPRHKRTFGVRPIERPLSQARHSLNVLATRGDNRMGKFLIGYKKLGLRYRKTTELAEPIAELATRSGFDAEWLLGAFEPSDAVPWGQFIDCGVPQRALARRYAEIQEALRERTAVPGRT